LAKHNLPFDEDLIFKHPITLAGGATVMEMAMRMAERPTAIFFADPMLAVGAVNQALSLGVRVPEDISIVGFDDTDVRFTVHPVMTAVCQDASALGFEAALRLTRLLTNGSNGSNGSFKKTLPTFFEVNESTGPAPLHTAGAGGEGGNGGMNGQLATNTTGAGGTQTDESSLEFGEDR
jgi:LacI family repressor for deo operon, udp, cdd, tsx, nupC, and nupG